MDRLPQNRPRKEIVYDELRDKVNEIIEWINSHDEGHALPDSEEE